MGGFGSFIGPAISIGSSLFGGSKSGGGGGGGGGGTPATTTTTQTMSPEQQRLLNLVIPEAERFITSPPELFPGSTIAPPDPLQGIAQENVLSLAGPGGVLEQFGQKATGASEFLLGDVLFPESNPALQAATEAAVRPLTQAFEQNILPGIRGEAITAGGFGGSRQGIAEAGAAEALLRQVGDVSSTVQAQAYQQSLDAMVKALFAAPSTAGLPLLPSAAQEAVGTQRRVEEQARLSEEAQRFLAEQLIPFSAAQDVAALAFGIPGGQTTSTSALSQGGGGGFLQGLLGLSPLIAPLFGGGFGGGGGNAAMTMTTPTLTI